MRTWQSIINHVKYRLYSVTILYCIVQLSSSYMSHRLLNGSVSFRSRQLFTHFLLKARKKWRRKFRWQLGRLTVAGRMAEAPALRFWGLWGARAARTWVYWQQWMNIRNGYIVNGKKWVTSFYSHLDEIILNKIFDVLGTYRYTHNSCLYSKMG